MVASKLSIRNDAEAIAWLASIGAMSQEEAFFETARTVEVEDTLGGVNRFYLHCEPTDNGMSYGVCRHIIRAFSENRLTGFNECLPHLQSGNCPAMKMLAAETEAGHALFYVKGRTPEQRAADLERERVARQEARDKFNNDWQSRIEERRALREADEARVLAEKPPAEIDLGTSDYAAAINAAIAAPAATPPAIDRAGRKAAPIARGAKLKPTSEPQAAPPSAPAASPPGRISLAEIARNKLKGGQ